jgi:hypothetical protein
VRAHSKDDVCELSNWQRPYPDKDTETPHISTKSAVDNRKGNTSVLDNDHLQTRSGQQNGAKQPVVQDPGKYIDCRRRVQGCKKVDHME